MTDEYCLLSIVCKHEMEATNGDQHTFQRREGRKTAIGASANKEAAPNNTVRLSVHEMIGRIPTHDVEPGDAV